MKSEYRAMRQELQEARRYYEPPQEDCSTDGKLICVTFELAEHTIDHLQQAVDRLFDPKQEQNLGTDVTLTHALSIAAYSLIAGRHGLRMYSFGANKIPCELPGWLPKENDPVPTETSCVWTWLGAWSLITYMEERLDVTPDRAARYGLAAMQAVWGSERVFGLVDKLGRVKTVDFDEFNTLTQSNS